MELVTPTRCPQCNSSEFTPKPVNTDWSGGKDPDFDLSNWEDDETLVECNYCHSQFKAKGVRKSFDYRNKPTQPAEPNELITEAKSVGFKIIACFFYLMAFFLGLMLVVGLFQVPFGEEKYRSGVSLITLIILALMTSGLFVAGRRFWHRS